MSDEEKSRIKKLVIKYMESEGCRCCEDTCHNKDKKLLKKALGID